MPGILKYNTQDLVFVVILVTTVQRVVSYLRRLPVLCAILHTVICGAYTYPIKLLIHKYTG